MSNETPQQLTSRISKALHEKLSREENCLKLLQFDILWLLHDIEWRREEAEAKLAIAQGATAEDVDAQQSEFTQADLFGGAA